MAEYSRIAKGHVTSVTGGGTPVINLPFQPQIVKWKNLTAYATPTDTWVTGGYWDASMGQGTGLVDKFNATPVITTASLASGGVFTFSAGTALQYGPLVLLGGAGGIAKTSSSVLTVTTTAAHGLVPGNVVVFQNLYQTSTSGMQQIAGIPFEVLTAPTTTTFTIGWNGTASNLTAITGAATGACGFKQVLYPNLYAPGVAVVWSAVLSNGVVTVKTTAPHNYQVGQEIGFSIPSIYGATQLNENYSPLIPASPQYFYVTSVAKDQFTFNYSGSMTAFSLNAQFASFPGLQFPLVRAVGDVNSGGNVYAGGNLYPSPLLYSGFSQSQASTINGPAIQGAFVNNTSQGFFLGVSAAPVAAQDIYWEAYLVDLAVN